MSVLSDFYQKVAQQAGRGGSSLDLEYSVLKSRGYTGTLLEMRAKYALSKGWRISDYMKNVAIYGFGVAPGAPTGVSAVAGNAQATVSFTAPASPGDSAITGYRVTSSTGQTATGSASPIVVTGLTNGVAVTFTVAAQNSTAGYGPESTASAAVTPVDVVLGPELLLDPGFDTGTGWTLAGSTISGSQLSGSFDNSANFAAANVMSTPNATYRCAATVSAVAGFNLALKAGGTLSTDISAPGTYTFDLVRGAGTNFVIQGTSPSTTTATVTSASVKRKFPSGNIVTNGGFDDASGWSETDVGSRASISGGTLQFAANAANDATVSRSLAFTAGASYTVYIDVVSVSAADGSFILKLIGSGGAETQWLIPWTTLGQNSTTIVAPANPSGTGTLQIFANANSSAVTFDNVAVVPV